MTIPRLLLIGWFVSLGVQAWAGSPSVGLVLPRGGQRGTEVTLAFQGANLADTQEILVYYPGITIKKIESVAANEVRATAIIAADCRLGEHAFRVRTATGISDLRTFWVGALPIVDEKEPNNDPQAPQPITMNVTVHGTITNEDVDYFVVECKMGQRLSVEIEGMRLGTTFFDPTVTIFDEKNFELAVADDSYITGQDGGASIAVPADGKYIIQVREASFQGNGSSFYRLHVGTFPRPTAMIPAGGKPGETIEARFLGDPLGEIKQSIMLPTNDGAPARVHATTADGIHPAGIRVRINDLPTVIESPGVVGPTPCAFHGVIGAPNEIDYFTLTVKKGETLSVACYARRLGSALDPVLHVQIFDANNKFVKEIAVNDDNGGVDAAILFNVAEDGVYKVAVHDHLLNGGPAFFYRIEVTGIRTESSVRLPRADGNNPANQDRQTWSIPKGGRLAVPVILGRAYWGGPGRLEFENLPPGVTATVDPIDFSMNPIPVILESKPDAAVGVKLSRVRLQPEQGSVQLIDPESVDVPLATGPNQTIFHRLSTDRVAIAITESAPFSIEAVEPKVPLVQNGSMQLKVIAKRSGYNGPITVLPVNGLPGVGIVGAATIPENGTECLLAANAAANAPPGKRRLAFHAVANTGGGNIWVGSQLITIEVTPPLVTLAQQRAAVEQGAATSIVCKVTTNTPFSGKAKATLVGLPPKVTAAPVEFDSGAAEIVFAVTTDKTSPAGKHNTFVQLVIEKDGETIAHNLGGAELRIDVPIAPKTAAAPTATPKAAAPAAKPISRLEQLRKEQEEKEKSEKKPDKP